MLWFTKNRIQPNSAVEPEIDNTVEIIAHKEATKKQVEAVKDANQKLKEVFERNHFTVKLYVAVGGQTPKAKGTN